MKRHAKSLAVWMSLGMVVAAVGCAEQKKPGPVPDQGATSAADRINELQSELNQCRNDLAACQERELAMRNENDRLKEQLAQGSPATEAGWTSVPGGAMIAIEGTVLFDSGKADLRKGGADVLNGVAGTIMDKYAGYDVYVFGHTDNEPIRKSGWKDNYELSAQRALTVLRQLQGQGVSKDICACGWGEDRPVADNKSPSTRQPNRRVEIFVMAKANK
ncbi:MAG TPA: OmpA family protein [Phycisphaerae bacterium]|nr:OmpA family protein [Phycisphaerae bacterium]